MNHHFTRLGNVARLFRDWRWTDKMFDVMADVGATTCLAGHTHKFGITIRRGRRLAVGGARGTGIWVWDNGEVYEGTKEEA